MAKVIILITLGTYVGALILLALRDARRHTVAKFMIAERQVGWFGTMASIAGNLRDGAGLAAWVLLGIYYGFGALWLTTGLALALLLLGLFAPEIRRLAGEGDYITVNQLIAARVGRHTARLSVHVIAVTALLYAGAQVYVSGRLFASLLAIPAPLGMALTALVVGTYIAVGGYATTIRTGIVQWCIIMVIVVLPWIVGRSGSLSVGLETLTSPGLASGLAFAGISFLVTFSSADIWQLLFSASSPRTARTGFLVTIPVYYLISVGLVLFAYAVRSAVGPGVAPGDAFFALFSLPSIPPFVLAIVGVFVAAAVMSTLDSQVFLFTSTVVRELLPSNVDSNSPLMEKRSRVVLMGTMAVLALVAASIGNIIEFLFSAVTLGTVLTPVLLLAVLRPNCGERFDKLVTGAVLVAAVVYAVLFAKGAFANLALTLVPASIATGLCGLAYVLTGRNLSTRGLTSSDT